jgi:hypothetical protein
VQHALGGTPKGFAMGVAAPRLRTCEHFALAIQTTSHAFIRAATFRHTDG